MKKSILLITSFCVLALGVLGYTFLYAGSAKSEKESAAACEKAHAGSFYDAASTAECPHAAKAAKTGKSADGCCASMGAADAGADASAGKTCPTFAKVAGGTSKEDCAKFHATAKADAEAEKIEIK